MAVTRASGSAIVSSASVMSVRASEMWSSRLRSMSASARVKTPHSIALSASKAGATAADGMT